VRLGGARPPPFNISTITYKVVVYAPAERADTFPLSHLYPFMYSVVTLQSTTNTQPPTTDDYEPTTVYNRWLWHLTISSQHSQQPTTSSKQPLSTATRGNQYQQPTSTADNRKLQETYKNRIDVTHIFLSLLSIFHTQFLVNLLNGLMPCRFLLVWTLYSN
jgi:hypothetical protein